MKKLIVALFSLNLTVISPLGSLMALGVTSYHEVVNVKSENNVGNGEQYAYEITEINGDEINGLPLNKISDDNRGILLYQNEVAFDVKIGDKIIVVWGEYEDVFKSIEKAVVAEDGSLVSTTYYE